MVRIKPSEKSLRFMEWEMGVFFHFGIRSFFLGHKDWDNREMPASAFNPDHLDCEQWIRVAKDIGAAYTILVCKHHDGFANWPSKYGEYSVANSPWKDGKGDVVREYVDACRKYDMKVGLYYSPAQWGGKVSFVDGKDYDDYFIGQVSELLSNYGKIDYLWFDGCGSDNHEYDRDRIVAAIRGLQPDILIFAMWDPDTRWIGNEDGYAAMMNLNVIAKNADAAPEAAGSENLQFLPGECDFKMRSTWFDCEENEDTIKTAEELVGIYEMSVGRGANFLVNVGPSREGVLPEADVNRLMQFRKILDERYGKPLSFSPLQPAADLPDTFVIEMPKVSGADWASDKGKVLVDAVILEEDLTNGESVTEFRIYANLPHYTSQRICLYKGDTIGHKVICKFPTIRTGRITVEVTAHSGDYQLKSMVAYYTKDEK